jgi:hypothetical protein
VPTATPEIGPHTLTIRYEFLDGTQAAPTYQAQLMPGDPYSRENPEIPGYTTARIRIEGVMGDQDITIVVLYIRIDDADEGETTSIDDYEVPLGLDNLYAQMGVEIE